MAAWHTRGDDDEHAADLLVATLDDDHSGTGDDPWQFLLRRLDPRHAHDDRRRRRGRSRLVPTHPRLTTDTRETTRRGGPLGPPLSPLGYAPGTPTILVGA